MSEPFRLVIAGVAPDAEAVEALAKMATEVVHHLGDLGYQVNHSALGHAAGGTHILPRQAAEPAPMPEHEDIAAEEVTPVTNEP